MENFQVLIHCAMFVWLKEEVRKNLGLPKGNWCKIRRAGWAFADSSFKNNQPDLDESSSTEALHLQILYMQTNLPVAGLIISVFHWQGAEQEEPRRGRECGAKCTPCLETARLFAAGIKAPICSRSEQLDVRPKRAESGVRKFPRRWRWREYRMAPRPWGLFPHFYYLGHYSCPGWAGWAATVLKSLRACWWCESLSDFPAGFGAAVAYVSVRWFSLPLFPYSSKFTIQMFTESSACPYATNENPRHKKSPSLTSLDNSACHNMLAKTFSSVCQSPVMSQRTMMDVPGLVTTPWFWSVPLQIQNLPMNPYYLTIWSGCSSFSVK